MRLPPALLWLLLAPAAMAQTQAYKWTDAHGTVHYSETPPPEGVSYKRLSTSGGVAANPAPAQPSQPPQAAPAPASTAPLADTPENRSKLCSSLQANLALLKGGSAVVMEAQGKSSALDDTQRRQQTALAEQQYRQYCGK